MTQQALIIRQDQTPITTELTARDVFNIAQVDTSTGNVEPHRSATVPEL